MVQGQNSQFLFDPNGNLQAQTAEISAPPRIIGQPQPRVVTPGEATSFFVVAADTRALAYQWRFNGTNIPGANNDSLLLQNVSANHEGEYRVVLTNPSGSVTSAPALLMIDSDADGLPDSWELAQFGSLTNSATTDFDRDGSSNLDEYLNGTDPANSNSVRFRLTVLVDSSSVLQSPDQTSYTNGQIVTLTANAFSNETFHAWLGDVVTRSNPVTLVMTNNKTIQARFTPIAFVWTNRAGSDWNAATNWTPNLVPGSNDSVVIVNANVTLNTAADCADVTLGGILFGATLTGSATLRVRGNFLWTQGTMTGSGRTVIETGGTLKIANPAGKGASLATRTLENGGTVLWTGGEQFSVSSGAVITNRPGALFHVQNAASLAGNAGAGRFDNAGTFRKSVDSGTTTVSSGISFNNSGAVEIQTGTLRLAGGGTNTGTFDATASTVVEWTVGSYTLNSAAQLNGAGLYKINNTTVTADTDLTVQHLDFIAGTLNGTGAVTIANAMNWSGGTMSGGGRTLIASGATLNATPSFATLNGRTLENAGTIVFTGAGVLAVNSSAVITNRPGALFRIESESASGLGGGAVSGRFDNAGTFRKSAGIGTSTVASGLTFNNSGSVEIQTGTLSFAGGGTHSGGFDVPGGTALILSGTHTANASSLIAGAGQLTVSGGTASLAGLVNVSGSNTFSGGTANLTGNCICTNNTLTISGGTANFNGIGLISPSVVNLSNGTLGGSSLLTVLSQMNWTGGTMSGSGRTIISPGATLNAAIPSVAILSGRTLDNGGTISFTGTGNLGVTGNAVITNRPGGLFNFENESTFGLGGSANGRFDNAGTFRKSAGTGTSTVVNGLKFTNYKTVDIRSGILAANGGYDSSSGALLSCALGGTTPGTGYGRLQVAGTVTLNGGLSVDLINGFVPATNDTFTVLSAGTRNGTFANFSYPSNALTMQLSNSANSVLVRVTQVLPVISQPKLLPPEISGVNFKLTWTARSNTTYRVEFNPDLMPSNWTALPGDVVGLSNIASKLDALTPSNRLYRVRVLP